VTDIVDQLRQPPRRRIPPGPPSPDDLMMLPAKVLAEAADEIERLRHEEMRLRTALTYHVNELREARRDIDRLRGAA